MKKIISLLVFLFSTLSLAYLDKDRNAFIKRYDKIDINFTDESLLEITIYNGKSNYLYNNIFIPETKEYKYKDMLCPNDGTPFLGQLFYKKGLHMICFRFKGCEKDLYFCKSRLNPHSGEAQPLHVSAWKDAYYL